MKRLIMLVVVILAVTLPVPAAAHVVLRDNSSGVSALFHVTPDDDPVAGEAADLYFDITDNSSPRLPYTAYQLVVVDERGSEDIVPTAASGSTVIATYTFKNRGLYRLTLRNTPIHNDIKKVSLQTALRVSRGEGTALSTPPTYLWAQSLYLGSGIGLIMFAITAWNRRKKIMTKSTW